MKYTIIESGKTARFISRDYNTVDEANKKIEALNEKFPNRYSLEVVGVDGEGKLHKLTEETKKQKAS